MKRSLPYILVATILLITLNGCYTVIMHPSLSEEYMAEQEYYDSHVTHMDDCSSCHQQKHTKFHSDYTDYYSFPDDQYNYDWEFYYDTPWWMDSYYVSKRNDRPVNPLPPTQRRDIGRRGVVTGPTAVGSSPVGGVRPVAKQRTDGITPAPKVTAPSNKRTTSRRDTSHDKRKTKKSAGNTRKKE